MPKVRGKFKRALGKAKKRRAIAAIGAYRKRMRPSAMRFKNTVNTGLGFPKKMIMTHKYYDTIKLTSTTSIMSVYQITCNGMYDPDITGTGHQPMNFDQMSALYNHYTVIGSRIKVRFVPSSSLTKAVHVGLFINDDTVTTGSTIRSLAEQQTGTMVQLAPLCNTSRVLSKRWSAKKYFGKSVLANNELQGSPTSNPTEQAFYTFAVEAFDGGTESLACEIEVEYIAVWKEIKDIAPS